MPQENKSERPAALGILAIVGFTVVIVLASLAYVTYNATRLSQEEDLSVEEVSFIDDQNYIEAPYAVDRNQLQNIADDGVQVFRYFEYQQEESSLPNPQEILENDQLSLSSQQESALKSIANDTSSKAADLASQILEQEQAIDTALLDPDPQQAEIVPMVMESGNLYGQLRATVLQAYLQIIAVLDKNQVLILSR